MKYKEVPVDQAKQIAEKFDKDVAVILTYNLEHDLFHTTTYGKGTQNKLWAADLGDIVTRAAGADMEQKNTYSDFREPKSVLKDFHAWLQAKMIEEDIHADIMVFKMPEFIEMYIKEKK